MLQGLLLLCLLSAALGFLHQPALRSAKKPATLHQISRPDASLFSGPVRRECALHMSVEGGGGVSKKRAALDRVNKLFFRASWVSWWVQIVLSVISSVILVFANTVRAATTAASPGYIWTSGFAFSGVGVLLALLNSFWTWNCTRLCRRISLRRVEEANAVPSLRKYARTSVMVSLIGMLFSLLGAEQIVGTLAAKILTSSGYAPLLSVGATNTPFQAVDIFLVQANTNAIFSHFVALVCYVLLQTRLPPAPAEAGAEWAQ
ncbi:hypothetical protein B484DRAFT_453208 [Ochromonadaceae sp. CCMP2298]|nr:hypothetical protein B484DRAFT_453208 [Ochromonadaceae sp. CCMP2298]